MMQRWHRQSIADREKMRTVRSISGTKESVTNAVDRDYLLPSAHDDLDRQTSIVGTTDDTRFSAQVHHEYPALSIRSAKTGLARKYATVFESILHA
jgi:hypothetical protein